MDLKQNVFLCLEVLMLYVALLVKASVVSTIYGQNPLQDPKNKHHKVFMDMVDFLRPRFVLMENVVDLLKFSKGFLGRYALSWLVGMNYQARLGMMAVGAYGLPQFCMRIFMWCALPGELNTIAYDEGHDIPN